MAVIRLLLLTLVCITIIDARKCYTYSQGSKKIETTCASDYCIKDTKDEGACDLLSWCGSGGIASGDCAEKTAGGVKGTVCCCDTDLCNGAMKTSATMVMIVMLALAMIVGYIK